MAIHSKLVSVKTGEVQSHGILPIMNHASLPDRSLIFSNQD